MRATELGYANADLTSWVVAIATLSHLRHRLGRLDEAAELAGIAEWQGTLIGFSAQAMDPDIARYATELRAALPPAACAAAAERARAVSPADAMRYVRQLPPVGADGPVY